MKETFGSKDCDAWAKTVFGDAELAYKILGNPETRAEYDEFLKLMHDSEKKSAAYWKSIDSDSEQKASKKYYKNSAGLRFTQADSEFFENEAFQRFKNSQNIRNGESTNFSK